jgi:hypothetical protein
VTCEERLVAGDVLQSYDAVRTYGDDLIDELHRIAVWEQFADAVDVHYRRLVRIVEGCLNLVLAYLASIGEEAASSLLSSGRVWLYDSDPVAMDACVAAIAIAYGTGAASCVHKVAGDFLDSSVRLPDDCKVISNPPYHRIRGILPSWDVTEALMQCRDLYGAFMEKIVSQSVSSVIITPYSFIGSRKFSALRWVLDRHSGFIVSFDNVPSAIFNGRKKGVFNTNTANSTRAAITVTDNKGEAGYRVSPLLRFSASERGRLLDCGVLEGYLGKARRLDGPHGYPKCYAPLEPVLDMWNAASDARFGDLVRVRDNGNRSICMPTTCRYYLSGTVKDLVRSGKRTYWIADGACCDLVYAYANSSFAYWHWRLYDGGVTYPAGLLEDMPVVSSLPDDLAQELHGIVEEMIAAEESHLVYKMNAGRPQENVKFPASYRERLDSVLLRAIGSSASPRDFDWIRLHSLFN